MAIPKREWPVQAKTNPTLADLTGLAKTDLILADLTGFVGMQVERDVEHGTVALHQSRAIEELAEKWLPADSPLRKRPPSRPCDEKTGDCVTYNTPSKSVGTYRIR